MSGQHKADASIKEVARLIREGYNGSARAGFASEDAMWTNVAKGVYHAATEFARADLEAARISAERQPVSDEELLDTFNSAWNEAVSHQRIEGFRVVGGNPALAGIRAVRATIEGAKEDER